MLVGLKSDLIYKNGWKEKNGPYILGINISVPPLSLFSIKIILVAFCPVEDLCNL